jgi:hypothetical protein
LKLNLPFGKDNPVWSFQAEVTLRHVLLPLFHLVTRFLTEIDWQHFAVASAMAKTILELLDEHTYIDRLPFPPRFPVGLKAATAIHSVRTCMATAALLRYRDDLASVVRWIGGPHVAAHRDVTESLAFLAGKNDQVTHNHLVCIGRPESHCLTTPKSTWLMAITRR